MKKVLLLFTCILFVLLHSCLEGTPNSEIKSKAKRQVIIKKLNATSARIIWEDFMKQTFNLSTCPTHFFEVHMKAEGAKEIKVWKVGSSRRTLIIKDLFGVGISSVKVVSHMCRTTTVSTRWYKIPTEVSKKDLIKPPLSITVLAYENNIFVKWIPPKGRTKIEGYIVSYGEEVPDIFFKHVPLTQLNITLSDLKYSTRYVIGVRTFRKFQKGPTLYKILNTQEREAFGLQPPQIESSLLLAPTNLRLKTLSERSVLLQWNDPSLYEDQQISDERFYGVHYNKVNGEKNVSLVVKSLQVTIYDLEPNQWYKFKVKTVKGIVISPFTEEIFGKTLKKDSNISRKNSNFEGAFIENFGTKKDNLKVKRLFHKSLNRLDTKKNSRQKLSNPHSSKFVQDQSDHFRSYRFNQYVQVRVSALITWPQFAPTSLCDNKSISYLFRYKLSTEPDEKYIDSDHIFNFKLLDNLDPRKSYIYRVRYISSEGKELSWSQENILVIPLVA